MQICFIINDWDTMDPEKETTTRLIHECMVRGHDVAILYPNNLSIRNNIVYGYMKRLEKPAKLTDNYVSFHKRAKFKEQSLPLNGFDAVFVRKNPPIENLMLNFLDSIKNDTFIINDIDGMRKANNKLYMTSFHDPENEYIPLTYVSKNKNSLRKIIDEFPKDRMILKPLDGFGGSGVIVLEKSAKQNINSLLDFYIDTPSGKKYVILQEFIEGIEKGDVRVLMLNGKPIGAYKRIPAKDDIRANIHAGGRPEKHSLSPKEIEICKNIGPRLIQDGLYFAGVDIINEKLIEVNVLSPGGIANINRLNKTKLQKKVIDFVEEVVEHRDKLASEKEIALRRKQAFKQEITNAQP